MSKTSTPQRRRHFKYQRAREALCRRIEKGEFPPGSRLPPEARLPSLLRVGQKTVQRVLSELTREGVLVRRRGSGTFVADQEAPPLIQGRHVSLGLAIPKIANQAFLEQDYFGELATGVLKAWGIQAKPEALSGGEKEATCLRWEIPARGISLHVLGESPHSQVGRRPRPGPRRPADPRSRRRTDPGSAMTALTGPPTSGARPAPGAPGCRSGPRGRPARPRSLFALLVVR